MDGEQVSDGAYYRDDVEDREYCLLNVGWGETEQKYGVIFSPVIFLFFFLFIRN